MEKCNQKLLYTLFHINLHHIFLLSAFRMGSGASQRIHLYGSARGHCVCVSLVVYDGHAKPGDSDTLMVSIKSLFIFFLASLPTNLTFFLFRRNRCVDEQSTRWILAVSKSSETHTLFL